MAVPLEQFVKLLEDSGILAGDTLQDFLPPKKEPKSAEELALDLVRNKKLTKFQAEEVSKGKGKSLTLGNYVLMEKIGAGGMGQVFKAEHRRMDRLVAVKLLPAAMTKDKAAIARFEREVKAAARISHPNIVAAFDADQANGVHFLVMEYVAGSDLSALVKKSGPFSVEKAVNYILQAAKGLEAAHKKGIVHRDIKPANLLLDTEGTVKILDMGLARIEHGDGPAQAELTGTGTIMGTVDYMAPEQAMDTKSADARADIYSLGCSLYYLLSGKATYDGDTLMQKLMAHQNHPIPCLRTARPEVPEELEAVFNVMVAKKVEDRYQTMSAVVAALEALPFVGRGSTVTRDEATVKVLSAEERSRLSHAGSAGSSTQPLSPLGKVVASEKTKNLLAKIIGGVFASIIAPILVTFLIKYLEKDKSPPNPPDATATAATAPREVVATSTTPQPTSPATSSSAPENKSWNTSAFQQWMDDVQAMPAEKQIEAVSKQLQELNPGFDGKMMGSDAFLNDHETPTIEHGVVTELCLKTEEVTDLSPLQAFASLRSLKCNSPSSSRRAKLKDLSPLSSLKSLRNLNIVATQVSDLNPLRGMVLEGLVVINTPVADLRPLEEMASLKKLFLGWNPISDLAPLKGTALTILDCRNTEVSDVSPLKSLPLTTLGLTESRVSDLSPLEGMTLTTLSFTPKNITRGIEAVRQMKTLKAIGAIGPDKEKFPPAEFWKKYDAGEFGKPTSSKSITDFNSPAFQKWMKDVATMPAEEQVKAVSKKLIELNPGFDGTVAGFDMKGPPKIENGVVTELGFVADNVPDISPVRALVSLKKLICTATDPLQCQLADLSPLIGMPLTTLDCGSTQVADLTPLQNMKLAYLGIYSTRVSNLSPLKGLPLKGLYCAFTQVSDLSPLKGMELETLTCPGTQVSDLSPIKGMPLKELLCDFKPERDTEILRSLKTLETINEKPAAEFWNEVEEQQQGKKP